MLSCRCVYYVDIVKIENKNLKNQKLKKKEETLTDQCVLLN